MSRNEAETAELLQKQWSGPITEAQVAFLRDVQGFIDFVIRNRLSFPMVVGGLLNDLNEIARDGFDYEKARARGFVPKVMGFSQLTSDSFGESEEEEPAS